jgi:hypothetical protein
MRLTKVDAVSPVISPYRRRRRRRQRRRLHAPPRIAPHLELPVAQPHEPRRRARGVAAHVGFEKANFGTRRSHFRRAFGRYGCTGFTCTAPHRGGADAGQAYRPCVASHGDDGEPAPAQGVRGVARRALRELAVHPAVAVQVAFERAKGLKSLFHFKRSRVETRRFQAVGHQALSSCGSPAFNLYSPTPPAAASAPLAGVHCDNAHRRFSAAGRVGTFHNVIVVRQNTSN